MKSDWCSICRSVLIGDNQIEMINELDQSLFHHQSQHLRVYLVGK